MVDLQDIGGRLAATAFAAALVALTAATTARAETVLRFNQWLPSGHFVQANGLEKWAEMVGEVTDGRVTVEMTGSSLGTPPRQMDLATSGVADITWGVHGYTPGRFKTIGIVETGIMPGTAEDISRRMWQAQAEHFDKADEYRGVKLLGLHAHPPGSVFVNRAEAEGLGDLAGLKIRSANPYTVDMLSALGAVPVTESPTKLQELFSRGVIDGTVLTFDAIYAYHVEDKIASVINVPGGGAFNATFFLVMNEAAWNGLSVADQEAIMSVSGENFAAMMGALWDGKQQEAIGRADADGIAVFEAGGDDLATIEALRAQQIDAWLAEMQSVGVEGEAALAILKGVGH